MRTPPPHHPFWRLWERFTSAHVALFRATGGSWVTGRVGRAPMLLLHHVGRRTGEPRVSPLIYRPHGDDLVVVASKGGVDRHPAWFHNLMAAPETLVELPGRERRRVRARVASDEERPELWRHMVEVYRPYESYQRQTSRTIPVVVLETVSGDAQVAADRLGA